ncbi:arsenic resistance N-acetyltransferase ArsN2 [Dongia sedimenti]|uniref:Arsenic resistance N-acetyltransferase ArsN2 n=1 Tax=Dongia sedimenti TaxID=3064282 RepID=A0ABU0YML9_9PROT|nr:arsenic resistance N-acetyltransferase ArsN2 [Rhodospirillaceae bacterium R-7]
MRRVASALDLTSSKIAGLTRYWEAKRGRRPMPTWSDIDPAEIKPLLPHLLVTRYERNPFRARFVLVGTWLAQYAGGDFTGRYLDELDFSSEIDTDWPAHHLQFIRDARPTFGVCRFLTESGLEREYESAMFPIAGEDGITVERALGIEDFPVGSVTVPDERIIAPPPRLVTPGAAPAESRAAPGQLLTPIAATDAEFRRCLVDAKLPTADLVGAGKRYFRLVEAGQCRGYGGIEARGSHALLRSIVVEGRERGHGYGRTLVHGLVAEAEKLGLKDAYLLTETAAPFFAALGFNPCDRQTAPPEIAQSQQFAELCPASAKLMRREL